MYSYMSSDSVTWHVALKAPGGRKCMSWKQGDNEWAYDQNMNIDEWLRQQLCNQVWQNHLVGNDESPLTKTSTSFAHSKMLVVWDDTTVGWLLHSVPKFPSTFLEQNGQQTISIIPQAETEYGQSFVWLTMPVAHLPSIISQIQLNDPFVYGLQDDKSVWSRRKRAPAKKDALSLITLSDTLSHVAKHKVWQQDLYTDYLAPTFGALIQETWGRPSEDATATVLNAEELAWPKGDVKHNETHDHSKWAVSQDETKPWVFLGDINFQASQKHRGGGGVIITDARLWKEFKNLIISTDYVKKDVHGNKV